VASIYSRLVVGPRLKRIAPIPISGGESSSTCFGFRRHQAHMINICRMPMDPDLSCGGSNQNSECDQFYGLARFSGRFFMRASFSAPIPRKLKLDTSLASISAFMRSL
jgi:hypothetical protein